jgi:hypothetical protein
MAHNEDFSRFIPEDLGKYDTFQIKPGGSPITLGSMGDPMALYRSALGQETASNMENMRRLMAMRSMSAMLPQVAAMGDPMAMGMAQGVVSGARGIAPGLKAETGTEEFLAGLAHEKSMSESQNALMDYIHQLSKQGWLAEWAPVIGSILGAAMGGPLGSTIGGGLGETYSRSQY